MTRRSRITVAATAVTAATVVLTACGGGGHMANSSHGSTSGMGSMSMTSGGSSTSTSAAAASATATGPHNAADVTFATEMIPHHAQAVEMADMALRSAGDAQVKTLATAIKAAQGPEITQMSGCLTTWKKPVPAMSGMNMNRGTGMMGGSGMMSGADMARLGKATGASFDRLWVQMMIAHHRGAVATARTEVTGGRNGAAIALARSIVTSQSAQLKQLQTLLAQLPKS